MIIRFSLGEDVSILKSGDYEAYLDGDLQVFIQENNDEYLFFSTTIHSTILIHLSNLLIELHQNAAKQTFEPFGVANIFTLEKRKDRLIITNFDRLDNAVEWERTFDFHHFVKAYVATLKNYIKAMVFENYTINEHPSFILMAEKLDALEKIYAAN